MSSKRSLRRVLRFFRHLRGRKPTVVPGGSKDDIRAAKELIEKHGLHHLIEKR